MIRSCRAEGLPARRGRWTKILLKIRKNSHLRRIVFGPVRSTLTFNATIVRFFDLRLPLVDVAVTGNPNLQTVRRPIELYHGRDRQMRTEVKRSLLLWPALASITIIALIWVMDRMPALMRSAEVVRAIQRPLARASTTSDFPSSSESFGYPVLWPARSTDDSIAEIATEEVCGASVAVATDRADHGSRGVKLPERVARVFGQPLPSQPSNVGSSPFGNVLAPIRNSQHELAGLAAELRRNSDQVVVDDVPPGTCIVADFPLSTNTLQNLRNRTRVTDSATVSDRTGDDNSNDIVIDDSALEATALALFGPSGDSAAQRSNAIRVEPSRIPQSNRALAKPSRVEQPVVETLSTSRGDQSYVTDLPQIRLEVRTSGEAKHSASDWPAGWPVTTRLDEQLAALSEAGGEAGDWSARVSQTLIQLRSLPRLGDDRAGDLIGQLQRLTTQGESAAEAVNDRPQQVQWLRAVHALNRRVKVWKPVWDVTRTSQQTWMVTDQVGDSGGLLVLVDDVVKAVQDVRSELYQTGDEAGWTAYLLLDEVEDAATAKYRDVAKREERSIVAQRLLSRLSWHALQEVHLQWLDRASVRELAAVVRPWARGAVDYADLLGQIERQEADAIDLAAIEIADAVQTLRFADNPHAVEIADALATYYRNANVRMAISQDMLNRMLPTIDPKAVPISTTVMGSRVRGTSEINSQLAITLIPSPNRWTLNLQTLGNVATRSTGFSGPVSVRTSGNSNFVAATPIVISNEGVTVGDLFVNVNSQSQLRGIKSDYDRWPLVGSLVRSIAEDRFQEVQPLSNRIADRKIKQEVATEIKTKLDEQVDSATDQLTTMVLGPLGRLKLDPQVIDMQTTEDRLLARYRLAGDWQLAAFTPRPRAPRSSLMSVQVHQSAINNTLEQLVPRDKPMPIVDVITDAMSLFGRDAKLPDELPTDVTIQFARTRPITVEIEDGKLWVTMRIVRLSNGKSVDLTQFIVRAAYSPTVDGLNASLVRDGHLRISGPGMSMRERLPVRAIFNKVLDSDKPLPLTLPTLANHPAMSGVAVSQLELRGGWIGIALSEQNAPRVALKETP